MSLFDKAKANSPRTILAVVWLVLAAVLPLGAHNGPLFPIIENRKVDPYVVALWAHPDVGAGAFYVFVEPAPGGAVPNDLKIAIGVRSITGRLPEVLYPAERVKAHGQVECNATGRPRPAKAVASAAGDAKFRRQR